MSLFTPAEVKAHIEKAIQEGKWGLVVQSIIVNIFEELHSILNGVGNAIRALRMQNEYLKLRVDGGKSDKEAADIIKRKYGGGVQATASEPAAETTAPVQEEASVPATGAGGERLGADGEPLSPEDAEKEALMDAAINEGIKAGIANPVQ